MNLIGVIVHMPNSIILLAYRLFILSSELLLSMKREHDVLYVITIVCLCSAFVSQSDWLSDY